MFVFLETKFTTQSPLFNTQTDQLKSVLNSANLCFANLIRVFVEPEKSSAKIVGFQLGKLLLREPSSRYLSNLKKIRRSYVRGPKNSAHHVLGIFAQFGEPCRRLIESNEISAVDEEEIENKNG